MHNIYKIFKCFIHTKPFNVSSYKVITKENIYIGIKYTNINNALLGATESHALPIRLNDKKVSIYNDSNKEIEPLTKKEFDELMRIVS
ncbi:hypothetical protein ceV_486 [Chrysochromulina ericina virus CeV-01B]|uniref:Uncharacterized protein n=1 Tax=Chrysochromulina ericina virus CeV-01B TaxID=3070830 RepID=A0A0N9QXY8_9VIRU|nr:hypothetical protein ceV_486 [Chrysochromulina ericina virus]ALH23392.1 hypothetical protein ceV_486 [Chrysochromulina ericina virus CeV-01B]|tara:strand:- start:3322 stop:3585 length:264 start_codon:yes stop_codon:yes gene_type:complete